MRHELHLARSGFAALGAVSAAAGAAGWLVAGPRGAASACAGAALVAANHGIAVASTGWARTLGPRVVAVGYSVFVVRMLFVLGALGSLRSAAWVHAGVLAGTFCAAVVASLAAECVSYARGSYVPAWRTR